MRETESSQARGERGCLVGCCLELTPGRTGGRGSVLVRLHTGVWCSSRPEAGAGRVHGAGCEGVDSALSGWGRAPRSLAGQATSLFLQVLLPLPCQGRRPAVNPQMQPSACLAVRVPGYVGPVPWLLRAWTWAHRVRGPRGQVPAPLWEGILPLRESQVAGAPFECTCSTRLMAMLFKGCGGTAAFL